jgi:outer membrane immunogenic protein
MGICSFAGLIVRFSLDFRNRYRIVLKSTRRVGHPPCSRALILEIDLVQLSSLLRLALASASSLALTTAARAESVYNWTGFYVGLNAGYAWGRSDVGTSLPCPPPPPGFGFNLCLNPVVPPAVMASGSGSLNGSGFTGGVQAGYNWQSGRLVYGVEADLGAFDIAMSRQVRRNYPGFTAQGTTLNTFTIGSSVDTEWLATLRGRIGLAFHDVLLYASGGLALAKINTAHLYQDDTVPFQTSGQWGDHNVKPGFAIGAGAEWALGRSWSVKAEYLYLNFGKVTASGSIVNPSPLGPYVEAVSTAVDLTAHIARAGVNYRF